MEKQSDQFSSEESRGRQSGSSHDESSNTERSQVNISIPPYSEQEAEALEKKLVNKETFKEALQVLITWLERGECDERNAACFSFLINVCWDRIGNLQIEQKEYLEKIKMIDKNLLAKNCDIHYQLNEVEELFKAIEKKNISDNFTQNQLEKMQEIKADILDLKQNVSRDCVVEEKESNDTTSLEVIKTEDSVQKMRAKVGSLTYKVNTANKKKAELERKCKEYENEVLKLRAELEKKRRRSQK